MLLCKYPIKVLFLDDDKEFLNSLKLYYSKNHPLFEYYSDTDKFYQRIADYNPNPFINYYLSNLDEESFGQRAFAFNIQNISNEMIREEKQDQIAIVVVDQNLSNTKGLTVLQTINKPNLAKFLLTATTDNKTAVEAFNKRIINTFISKNTPDMIDELDRQIEIYIDEYFKVLSSNIIELIKLDNDRKSALNESEFVKLFSEIVLRLKIKEYYLLDTSGSYVLIDSNQKKYFLLISDLNSISSQIDILQENDISEDVINKVKNAEKILYLPFDNSLGNIEQYIFDATILKEGKKFAYCLLDYNPFSTP